jgi:hypothetical protein
MIPISDAAPGESRLVTDFDVDGDGLDHAIIVVGAVNPDDRYPALEKRLRRGPVVARRVAGQRVLVPPAHLLGPVRRRGRRPARSCPETASGWA